MNDSFFLKQAIELAKKYSVDGQHGPFGAIIVQNQQVIGKGWNKVVAHQDPTAHAEINAIRNACANIESHELNQTTIYSSCEPCPMCLSAIYWARIPRLVFASDKKDAAKAGFDDQFIYQQIVLESTQRSLKTIQLMPQQGWSVFEAWIQNQNRVKY